MASRSVSGAWLRAGRWLRCRRNSSMRPANAGQTWAAVSSP
ncbi:hypothetical protein [Candidatus Amarolinea dominans]